MKNKVIEKYNNILEEILIKYIFVEDINDILYQASRKYEEMEKLELDASDECKENSNDIKVSKKRTKNLSTIFGKEILSYTQNEELRNALIDFWDMRNDINKPFKTKGALTRLFNKLDKLSNNVDSVKIEILEKSIINNWQDIWAIKKDESKTYISKKNTNNISINTLDMSSDEMEKQILSNNDLDMF